MKFGSLFAGIGGFDLGLTRAGFTPAWQVEIDEFCNAVLEKHFPNVARFRDIRDCGAHNLERVDLVAGGFPCQDISVAGKGAGLGGERSGLWFEMLRVVRELRPDWVLAENVPALRTRGADTVLEGLEQAGYACRPLVVGADDVGAPHRRKRVWIVAYRNSLRLEGQRSRGLLDGERTAQRDDLDGRGGEGAVVAHADSPGIRIESGRLGGSNWASTAWPTGPGEEQYEWEEPRAIESEVGTSVDGVSRRLALRAVGNSVVPQIVEAIGRAIVRVSDVKA